MIIVAFQLDRYIKSQDILNADTVAKSLQELANATLSNDDGLNNTDVKFTVNLLDKLTGETVVKQTRVHEVNRGSYMSAHVLLNLLNELGKRDKMRGLPSILSLFCNEFNKFNNTRARMLDSIYHMTNTLKSQFWRKNVIILSFCTQRCYGRHNVSRKLINH